jgi:hypothetical protein
MSEVLNYAQPGTQRQRWRWGFWAIVLINGCSLLVIAFVSLTQIANLSTGIIGDSYGPIFGILIGIPYTLGHLLFGTLPAIVYAARYRTVGRLGMLPVLLASIIGLPAAAAFTVACIVAPRTHGTTC